MEPKWPKSIVRLVVIVAIGTALALFSWIYVWDSTSNQRAPVAVAADTVSDTGWDEVDDLESGQRYMAQTIELFLSGLPSATTGVFEFIRVPVSEAVKLQESLGMVETPWDHLEPGTATVLAWSSEDVVFGVPRPRHGVETDLQGDTLVVIVHRDSGLEMRAVVVNDALRGLRDSAFERVTTELTVGPFAEAG